MQEMRWRTQTHHKRLIIVELEQMDDTEYEDEITSDNANPSSKEWTGEFEWVWIFGWVGESYSERIRHGYNKAVLLYTTQCTQWQMVFTYR